MKRQLLGISAIVVSALFVGAAHADSKDQTQGQKDAHTLACAQKFYGCLGGCSQAVSAPLSQACSAGCDRKLSACQAEAAVSAPPLNKELPKPK